MNENRKVRNFELNNVQKITSLKVIFVPSYLQGNDGVINLSYYDVLPGLDLTVFPSYYEPWGYTPIKNIAYYVPTITTSLSEYGN